MSIKQKVGKKLLPPPVKARHWEHSMLFSADDDNSRPSARLLDLTIEVIKFAQSTNLDDIINRTKEEKYLNLWPGEHYKFLAGIVQAIKPKVVVELGTAKGLSALVMKKYLPPDSKILTFDIIEWKKYPGGNYLVEQDFADGRLIQYTDDLSLKTGFQKHVDLLAGADLIFVDAAKDGEQEQRFIDNFKTI